MMHIEVFLMNFKVIGKVKKHSLQCLIDLLNQTKTKVENGEMKS